MRTVLRRLPLVLLALLVPGLAGAQGLGDVAARERQKREAAGSKPKARVLSNDDLKKDSGKSSSSTDAAAAPADTGASQTSASSHRSQREQEAETNPGGEAQDPRQAAVAQAQAQVDSARSEVVAAEERVKALGDKLNPMSPSFIYGANQTGDAVGEEMRTREALKQAEAQLAQARDALVRATQAQERVSQGLSARPIEDR